jgi:predicted nuclease of predicted toxin-antitoxin system
MRSKIDENMPAEAAELLRKAGWDCTTVYEEGLNGAEDSRISAVCRTEQRVLFTLDQDFADIRSYPPADYPGIVVLCVWDPHREAILQLLRRALGTLEKEWAAHRLWIVEPSRIRVRGDEPDS